MIRIFFSSELQTAFEVGCKCMVTSVISTFCQVNRGEIGLRSAASLGETRTEFSPRLCPALQGGDKVRAAGGHAVAAPGIRERRSLVSLGGVGGDPGGGESRPGASRVQQSAGLRSRKRRRGGARRAIGRGRVTLDPPPRDPVPEHAAG